MEDRKKVILLTGVSGLLGHRVAEISPKDFKLISIGRTSSDGLPAHVDHLDLDLTDPNLSEQLPDRIDTVIHLAQSRRFREFPEGAADVFAVNTQSTMLLLEHAVKAGCKEFIYASTGGVYRPSSRLTESSSVLGYDEMQIYPASKLAAEAILGSYAQLFRVVVMRIFFMYGEHQHETMLIPRLINSIRGNRPISLAGNNGFRFNPLYVGDAANLVWALVNSEFSGVLNVAGPDELTLKYVCELLGKHIGKEPIFEVKPEIPVDFSVNLELLEKEFGQMSTSFEAASSAILSKK